MTSDKSRFFVWRFSNNDDPGDQLQKGIQEYIRRYQSNPSLILVPQGQALLPPVSTLEIRQDILVPPFRFYFQVDE